MSFIQAVREHYGEAKPEPVEREGAPAASGETGPYVTAVIRRFEDTPAGHTGEPGAGRNHALNAAAYRLGQAVGAGQLERSEVEALLEEAAYRSGYVSDDGITVTRGTIASGLDSGENNPAPILAATGELAPAVTVLDPIVEDSFWTQRDELAQLRQFARARMCSPWAVLGCALARVIVAVPPFVTLPPLVGTDASLNLYVALVGPSGTGKGAAEGAAADAINVGHIEVAHIGSGEGVAHLYAHREKGEVIRDREAVLFIVPEVDNLTALSGRQGSTLLPQLRMAWSGERLGFAYVDKTKSLPIEQHTYRLGLLLGVQPGRAAPLLDDADGGTPQRFLWMPTTDPDVPEHPPVAPPPLEWALPTMPWSGSIRGLATLPVPEVARATILAARRDRLRGDGEALDGHALLARLKVAAALALLAGRREITEDDWDLSATVMAVSDATRAGVRRYLNSKHEAVNKARGEAEADRAIVVAEKLDGVQIKRVARTITKALRRGEGKWMTRRDVAHTVASRDRTAVDDAIGALLDAGAIEAQTELDKVYYRLPEGT